MQTLWILSQSMEVHMSFSHVGLEGFIFLVFSILPGSDILSASFSSYWDLKPEGSFETGGYRAPRGTQAAEAELWSQGALHL